MFSGEEVLEEGTGGGGESGLGTVEGGVEEEGLVEKGEQRCGRDLLW